MAAIKNIFNARGKNNDLRYNIFVYTLAFAILTLIIYSSYIIAGKSFVYKSDGLSQHYPSLAYFGEWLRGIVGNIFKGDFTIPLFDFSIGYGSDVVTTMHYYGLGDPFSLLAIFVPIKYTEYLYAVIIILKLYFSGMFFILFCKKMNQDLRVSVLGAMMYIFCAYSLYASCKHPFFLTPMVFLPLVIIGTEKVFNKENPLLFIVSVSLCTLSNFYFSFMVILLTIIYVAIRFLCEKHQGFIKDLLSIFLRFLGFGIVAIMISAILLLPIVLVYATNGRAEVTNAIPLTYDFNYYMKLFTGFIGYTRLGNWNLTGYSPLSLVAVFYVFMTKGKYKVIKISFIVLTVMQLIPFFGYMISGFTYATNRFVWVYSFLLAFTLVYTLKDILKSDRKKKIRLLIISAVYTALVLAVYLFIMPVANHTLVQFVLLFAFLAVLLVGEKVFKKRFKQYALIATSVICVISIPVNAIYAYAPMFGNYVKKFVDSGKVYDEFFNSSSEVLKEDLKYSQTDFFRFSNESITLKSKNQNLFTNTAGVSDYYSYKADSVGSFLNEMSVPMEAIYNFKGLDCRSFLTSLASCKYFVASNNKRVPYGYTYVKQQGGYTLYENKNSLPLGYSYKSFITREEYEKLSSLEKQEALMQNVLLEDRVDGFSDSGFKLTSVEIPYNIVYNKNVVATDKGIYVKKKNATLNLNFNGYKNCETYLYIENMQGEYLDKYELKEAVSKKNKKEKSLKLKVSNALQHLKKSNINDFYINVNTDTTVSTFHLSNPYFCFYSGFHNFAANLGYSETQRKGCSITFSEQGYYSWDDIKIICQPMTNYDEYIESLSKDVLENVKLENNKVSGTVNLKEDKIFCLSIPYTSGWSCYVDGEKRELLRANTWSMALPLSSGHHTIELKYSTPGLKLGAVVTLLGVIFTIILSIKYAKKYKCKTE